MRKKKTAAFWRQKQYIIAGTLVILAVIGLTWFYTSEQTKERAQKEQELAQQARELEEQVAAAESETTEEELAPASTVVPPAVENEVAEIANEEEVTTPEEPAEPETKETTNVADTLHFAADNGLSWPLQGDVVLNYSMDQTVYFATLDQYKYNPAVIIAGAVNDKVYAAAKGKIADISNSEETGCTVTMDLGDGYSAIYGQLKELNFKVGDLVEEGQVIGYISEPTKYYTVEGSNLYFEFEKDGVPQDPVTMFE